MKLHTFLTLLLSLAFFAVGEAALVKSNGSGNWTTGSVWQGGAAPACGDSIVIQTGHTVTITTNQNYYPGCTLKMVIVLSGTLVFTSGRKLDLPCDSRVYLFAGGAITVNGGGSSNAIDICGSNYWNSGSGNLSGPSCLPPTLPGCATVLPIELSFFVGLNCGENICLVWKTTTEKNNKEFIIQKTENGSSFFELGTVASKAPGGNSQQLLEYTFEDQSPASGLNYYRLLQVDLDGRSQHSDLIYVEYDPFSSDQLHVYPNPGEKEFTLDCGRKLPWVRLSFVNSIGVTVKVQEHYNASIIKFELMEPGLYQCRVEGSVQASLKIVAR